MTQTMDLNKMGLAPISELEMQEIDGGFGWYGFAAVCLGVAGAIASGGIAAPLLIAGIAASLLDS